MAPKQEQRFLTDKIAYTKIAPSERSGESEADIDDLASSDSSASSEEEKQSGRGASEKDSSKDSSLKAPGDKGDEKEGSAESSGSKVIQASSSLSSSSSSSSGRSGSAAEPLLDSAGEPAQSGASRSSGLGSGEDSGGFGSGTGTSQSADAEAQSPAKRTRKEHPAHEVGPSLIARLSDTGNFNVVILLSVLLVIVIVWVALYFGMCWTSAWSPWGDCDMFAPLPPLSVKPCGKGKAYRRRDALHGRCAHSALEESRDCDLGPCALRDYLLDVTREEPRIPCSPEHRALLLKQAAATFGDMWSQLQSCVGSFLCCHSCNDFYFGELGTTTKCASNTIAKPIWTQGMCLSCVPSGRPPSCANERKTCREELPQTNTTTPRGPSRMCCIAVGPPGEEEVNKPKDAFTAMAIPLDDKNFERRPGQNAFLGMLENPEAWPTEPTESHCQRRCWDDSECFLYTFISRHSEAIHWHDRCVTWDRPQADSCGRSAPNSWIPEVGAYSGLKVAVKFSDLIVTVRTQTGRESRSDGPFALYVCSAPHECLDHSPIKLSQTSCQAKAECLFEGRTHHFVDTVSVPEEFELHEVRIKSFTDDNWVIVKIAVDLDGQVGIYDGEVSLEHGIWQFAVGCITTAGWQTTAEPGTPCSSKCFPGSGSYGWCWADKEHTLWGMCTAACHKSHEVRTQRRSVDSSAMSCAELNWPSWSPHNDDRAVCSASNAKPLRACSGPVSWETAKQFCEAVGARLCTASELKANEAAGTGCGYDRLPVWSSTPCPHGEGYLSEPGSGLFFDSTPERCMQATEMAGHARCCGDARKIEIIFTRQQRDRHALPDRMFANTDTGMAEWQVIDGINWKGKPGFFLQSGMLADQLPGDDQWVDIRLDDVPVAERGGEIEFYFSVDSEPKADALHFYIDGREQMSNGFPASGKISWQVARFAFPSLQGEAMHSFLWRYKKDSTHSYGADVARVDKITVFGVIGLQ